MSLLIKALDHLEKNKQASKTQQPTGEYVPDESLLLELVPVEPKESEESAKNALPSAQEAALGAGVNAERALADRGLSLEEEAGIAESSFATNKYAKPKVANKASQEVPQVSKPLPETSQATGKSKDAAKAKRASPQALELDLSQKAAAKVFVANKEVKAPSSKFALIGLGVVGAVLVLLGLQGYGYIKSLASPEAVVLKPNSPIQPQAVVQVADVPPATNQVLAPVLPKQTALVEAPAPINDSNTLANADGKTAAFKNKTLVKSDVVEDKISGPQINSAIKKTSKNKVIESVGVDENNPEFGNKNQKSITLVSKVQAQGVDPTLLAAYQAFTHGEDVSSQQLYRQVLQRDVRNVDALLGMAAIAQRQGRDADAQGWYQKVLEIEPRNSIAQTAIVSPQANTDAVGTESRIKSMIAQQPDGANLHAALGNIYAEQSQWPAAQEAYFNASRLAPNNADYAFNLAISLDQMGKSGLALKQYQRALDLLNKSGGTSPDRVQLEARIRELQ